MPRGASRPFLNCIKVGAALAYLSLPPIPTFASRMFVFASFLFAAGLSITSASPLASHILQHSRPSAPAGFTPVGSVAPEQTISFRLALTASNASGLEAKLASLSNPSSPDYMQWLSAGACTRASLAIATNSQYCACRRSRCSPAAVAGVCRGVQCVRLHQRPSNDRRCWARFPRKLPLRRLVPALSTPDCSGAYPPHAVVLTAICIGRPCGRRLSDDIFQRASSTHEGTGYPSYLCASPGAIVGSVR
jgi:hypothetical protein